MFCSQTPVGKGDRRIACSTSRGEACENLRTHLHHNIPMRGVSRTFIARRRAGAAAPGRKGPGRSLGGVAIGARLRRRARSAHGEASGQDKSSAKDISLPKFEIEISHQSLTLRAGARSRRRARSAHREASGQDSERASTHAPINEAQKCP